MKADGVVSLTNAGKNLLLSKPLYSQISVDVIPCCADLDHFDFNKVTKQVTEDLKKELGIRPGQKIITYLGSIGGWYMTNEMFAFYKQVLLQYPEFAMLILTKDDTQTVIREAGSAGIPPEKLFVRYAKRSDVPAFLSISDVSVFFIRPTFSKIASSPTKHAELMGMGIPVICNDIGDTGNIIAATDTGLVVKSFTIDAYNEVLEKLPLLLKLSKQVIRNAAFDYFDLEKGAAHYGQLYKKIVNRANPS